MIELPVLYTDRLILREICQNDALDMFEYAKNPMVGPIAGWEPHTTIRHTKAIISMFNQKSTLGQIGVFAVILKENNKMIGTIELHTYQKNFKAELGYTISPLYWSQGYATEASRAVVAWGFHQLNLKRIECTSFVNNKQSQRVCNKLGFEYEGIKKKAYQLYDGSIHDLACYAVIDDEFYRLVREGKW